VSYCLQASCLAHRERVFWQPLWSCWVHTECRPCEALAGEPDPTELCCRYCGASAEVDGSGRLLVHAGKGLGRWERQGDGLVRWADESYSSKCPVSPTFHHETEPLRFTGVKLPATLTGQ
jgi:hypothetical protein